MINLCKRQLQWYCGIFLLYSFPSKPTKSIQFLSSFMSCNIQSRIFFWIALRQKPHLPPWLLDSHVRACSYVNFLTSNICRIFLSHASAALTDRKAYLHQQPRNLERNAYKTFNILIIIKSLWICQKFRFKEKKSVNKIWEELTFHRGSCFRRMQMMQTWNSSNKINWKHCK